MSRSHYHAAPTRPSKPGHPKAGSPAKQENSAAIYFAKLKKLTVRKAALAALFLLPSMMPCKSHAQDNSAAYQALTHSKVGGQHKMKDVQDAKIHKVAKQFEGVFLTEMLRMARPDDKAAKGFSTGESGSTWRVVMDQALGEAAANNGGTGLTKQIEEAMRGRKNPHGGT